MVSMLLVPISASAADITRLPNPSPAPGSYGLEVTKRQPPPTTTASIAAPANGTAYSTSPITVSGSCTNDLLVEVYDNGALVGAINCQNSTYSIQVSLFTGTNDINATQFDDLDQASPDSNHISVTYNNADFQAFGTLVTLTSDYGRRAASPGADLTWPLLLSGGTGPYAVSVDWGDGKPVELKSQPLSGQFSVDHAYAQSGIYHVVVKVADTNGVSAFLQLVAVANGTPTAGSTVGTSGGGSTGTVTKVLWLPTAVGLVLLLPTYWLGRRSELVSLHRKLEHDVASYQNEESIEQSAAKAATETPEPVENLEGEDAEKS